jgi:ribonucleotide monophosphatase NagD (HAD superfamily)
MGKPGPLIYQAAASMLDLPPSEVLVIGDSVEHDIQGANENGMDSILICAGILAKDLAIDVNTPPSSLDVQKVAKIAQEQGAMPTYCMVRLLK